VFLCILCGAQVSSELRDFISRLLDKDVMQRLDVTAAMQHPWVTLGGSAPLASCRQQDLEQQQQQGEACGGSGSNHSCLGLDVSQEDIDAAIRQIGCSMSELMDVVFEEVTLQQGWVAVCWCGLLLLAWCHSKSIVLICTAFSMTGITQHHGMQHTLDSCKSTLTVCGVSAYVLC
jgi:serine/threonine protein kinase